MGCFFTDAKTALIENMKNHALVVLINCLELTGFHDVTQPFRSFSIAVGAHRDLVDGCLACAKAVKRKDGQHHGDRNDIRGLPEPSIALTAWFFDVVWF